MVDEVAKVPEYGLKLKLNHIYPENWSPDRTPPIRQIIPMISLIIRYLIYYIKIVWKGRKPLMDYIRMQRAKQIYGVPIGGIGAGSIGRGYKGEFCRYQLRPGMYEYNTVDSNQFIVTIRNEKGLTVFQSCLSTYKKKSKSLSAWKWLVDGSKCKYTGLYPRSWTEYDLSQYGIKLVCRQVSPILPHNYKDSSLPCAVFVWSVENISDEKLSVTIAFTFKNGTGSPKHDKESTCSSKPFSYLESEGVILYHKIDKMPCSYTIASRAKSPSTTISKCVHFDPNSDGKIPWDQLYRNGEFDKISKEKSDNVFGEMSIGVAAKLELAARNVQETEFSLVWDMPTVNFFYNERKYQKYYTQFFGNDAGLRITDYCFKNYATWEQEIYKWQQPILNDRSLPSWYKSAIFNETYFVSDGGSFWYLLSSEEAAQLPKDDPRRVYGCFSYLEGHEYRMFNTYDVHFYASFALVANWPKLQQVIQYDYKDAIFRVMPEKFKELYGGHECERKVKNSVPHDLGDPDEEPFLLINAYPIHDVSEWRDLNVKFVLQVFRDYSVHGDKQYLEDMYEALATVMKKSLKFDTDGDGIIDNTGVPDQTYDSWIMSGASAYCGGLWLAALYGMTVICGVLEKTEDKDLYERILVKSKESFESKLWNGRFYNFDVKTEGVIMADQLCGHWYLRASGHKHEVFPKKNVLKALKTIYENNVLSFQNANMGAVNGFTTKGQVDTVSVQSEEVWVGVTYGLAGLMLQEGMTEEAFKTAGGMYKTMSERLGLSYETPEALYGDLYYRSIGYMRPLSIWSIQLAIDQRKRHE